jgi:tRNA (mo5U34)-methyltransferase
MPEDASAVDELSWYHTVELPDGVVTRGHYDLRRLASEVLPSELAGKRCLDACSATGFWAFEMEKRGATEIVALDLHSYRDKDWRMPWLAPDSDEMQGRTFRVVKEALGSSVERRELSVYDVTAEELGTFDFVFIGSVLLHLRDPVRALRALRTVTRSEFVSFEPILLLSSVLHPQSPRGRMADGADAKWWTPNAAAHAAWLVAAGFEVVDRSWHRQPFGAMFPRLPPRLPRFNMDSLSFWLGTRQFGVPSQRLLARPMPHST